ncbi:MAG: helix-turn-helix domain-containing protein [Desulfobacterales bacterium]|nr:helix-turn-helix domain-containing protein [Desulfobacterales bacterium]
MTLDGEIIQGNGRVAIQPHASIQEVDATDCILLPGFLPPLEFVNNVPAELVTWIRDWHAKDTLIGTTCTGTFFLAETGLLDGKVATTNWSFARYFQKLYPSVQLKPERILTADGGLICSGATTSFLDLCLYIIEEFGSNELANRCSKSLLLEPNRHSQSPYIIFDCQKNHTDKKVLMAQTLMEEKFTETISVEALASDLGISPRHFKRRFKSATGDSPLSYLQRIRIEVAKKQLETTRETVDEITWQVGYEDSNSFRRLFRKYTGLSPREYRGRFTRTQQRAYMN